MSSILRSLSSRLYVRHVSHVDSVRPSLLIRATSALRHVATSRFYTGDGFNHVLTSVTPFPDDNSSGSICCVIGPLFVVDRLRMLCLTLTHPAQTSFAMIVAKICCRTGSDRAGQDQIGRAVCVCVALMAVHSHCVCPL